GHDGQGAHGRVVQAEAAGHGEHEQAVGDGAAEGGGAGELVVHVDGVEVAAEAGEIDDVGFGNGAAQGLPVLPDLDVLEVQVLGGERHRHAPRNRPRARGGALRANV